MEKREVFFEKVNPMHPDKIADRIAGAIVDLCYKEAKKIGETPICAVEVLIGHGECNIMGEVNIALNLEDIKKAVHRIAKDDKIDVRVKFSKQDFLLKENQEQGFRCGDNGIFKGVAPNGVELAFTNLISMLYEKYKSDGKGIIHYSVDEEGKVKTDIIICQSNAEDADILKFTMKWFEIYKEFLNLDKEHFNVKINPLGFWTGGLNVDTGATNRKLGSDMGRAVTGGGLMGKDLSKADITLNLLAYKNAHYLKAENNLYCVIGDEKIEKGDNGYGNTYFNNAVNLASNYINNVGGFEKFAEWGIIQPTIPYGDID